jgi:sarcosine oxidase subunit beta
MIAGLLETAVEGDLVDPDDYSEHVDDAYVLEVGTRWIQRCPTVETAEPRRGYTGVMAITPDWHPIIDEVPEGSGHFLCTGFSGHGFKLAPAVGLMTTDLVLGEQTTAFDTKVFRLSRYAENDLVRGRYEYSITG